MMRINKFLSISSPICAIAALIFLLNGCSSVSTEEKVAEEKSQELVLTKSTYAALPYWGTDTMGGFADSYKRSCERILKKDSQTSFFNQEKFGKYQEWQIACRKFNDIDKSSSANIQKFFEENFIPYQVTAGSEPQGLFTGYYEASLRGSYQPSEVYKFPLRARPQDLVMVDLGQFREELKGQRIAGRVQGGNLKPYETHAEIMQGKLPKEQDIPLLWVDSAVDAFFVQIQGSGVVQMEDGSAVRIGYDGQNGHPYTAVGKTLIEQGALTKENVSMQTIRAWMETNPDKAQDVMQTNKSYVFFRRLDTQGPIGGEGVVLTAQRSLAIDRSIIPYAMPLWLVADHPQETGSIARLMMTQDTGGAIRGPVRGDFFWGYGEEAAHLAGLMKSKGQYWFLLPKTL